MTVRKRIHSNALACFGLIAAALTLGCAQGAPQRPADDALRSQGRQDAARTVVSPARNVAPAHRLEPRAPERAARGARAPRAAGSLPQTHMRPPAHGAALAARMADLWAGVQRGSLSAAVPAFFPRRAYVQLKAIPSAGGDWQGRLLHDFGLDIRAAHALLGGHAREARLVSVQVPESYAHWVPPGVCLNGVGYYEVPNTRIVYRAGGRIRSLGIASMISWRGAWYVVHLGAILRSSDTGTVDEPSSGRGVSRYSGTC
ncbi:MAG TPA: hypothetical protein VII03_03420 [Solirubrobacteraceae bacterium]